MQRTTFLGTTSAGVAATLFSSRPAAASTDRAGLAYERRVRAAAAERARFRATATNGDEARYAAAGYLANFSKGLPHGADGIVDPEAYRAFVRAIETRDATLLDPRTANPTKFLVTRSQTVDGCVAGCDPFGLAIPAPPTLDSAEQAREIVELAWLALTRDIPFAAYETDATIARACADLGATPATIFRPHGGPAGPQISQFLFTDLLHPTLGALSQRQDYPVAKNDFVLRRDEWLAMRNGVRPAVTAVPREGRKRYLATGRDLADWVYRDGACFDDALTFIEALPASAKPPIPFHLDAHGLMGMAFAPTWIATFYQKFAVHRRLRPEELFGLIDAPHRDVRFHPSLGRSRAIPALQSHFKTALLPQAYPTGSPPHPAYPAAHATTAGLSATILKAFVKPDAPWPKPVVPSADGMELTPYRGAAALTIAGEIDRLAINYAYGRHVAGVHYRSDSDAGLRLGEAAALSVLRDVMAMCDPSTPPLHVTTFDGEHVTISA